jgi:hypothetical protein
LRAGVFRTAAFVLTFLLLAATSGHAQSPTASPPIPPAPLPGYVPPYEITKIVRASGFDPLAPPRREGTTYVLRATDFRGILFRIVVDARSGAIRAANRIVPGNGPYGPVGVMGAGPYGEPPPYGGPPPYGMIPPPYGPPMGGPEMGPEEAELGPPMGPPGPPPPGVRSSMYPPAGGPAGPGGSNSLTSAPPEAGSPPLPRPRPPGLAAREAQPPAKPPEPPTAKPDAEPAASSAPPTAPPPAAVAPAPSVPAAPKKPLPGTPIPD